jgi:hypothetical protein
MSRQIFNLHLKPLFFLYSLRFESFNRAYYLHITEEFIAQRQFNLSKQLRLCLELLIEFIELLVVRGLHFN